MSEKTKHLDISTSGFREQIKRGLFKTVQGKIINADVNGSYNIMKKAIPNAFANGKFISRQNYYQK